MTSRPGISASLREPLSPADAALRRDEAGDRTREQNRSGVLDALRAVAALMVVVDHTHWLSVGPHPGTLAAAISKMLAGGIYLFFAVSGYLIAGPFLRALVTGGALPSSAPYFMRRAARIYPGYWAALVAFLLLPPATLRPYQAPVHLLLLQSIWPHAYESTAVFPVAWTLGIEILFYVCVPPAARILRALHPEPWRAGRLAVVISSCGVADIAWTYFASRHFAGSTSVGALLAQSAFVTSLAAFCPGMVVALAALAGPESWGWRWFRALMSRPWLCFSLAGLFWLTSYAMFHYGSQALIVTSPALYYLACGLILGCCVVAGTWISRPVRLMAPLGLVSYGIYLWHPFVLKLLYDHTSLGVHGIAVGWAVDVLLVLALTLPLAVASWVWIERPAMRSAAKWAKRRTRPAQADALISLGGSIR